MFDRDIFRALIEEIGCDECFEQLDRFVEMRLSGLDAAQAMPLEEHLENAASAAKSSRRYWQPYEQLRRPDPPPNRQTNCLGQQGTEL
jgi:hypothetical protein